MRDEGRGTRDEGRGTRDEGGLEYISIGQQATHCNWRRRSSHLFVIDRLLSRTAMSSFCE